MKISVDDQPLFVLSEIQKKVIKNDIPEEEFEADMRRRLQWILQHKYERCFERLKTEWEPKLAIRVRALPTDKDELAQLIFSQPDYQDRSRRETKVSPS